MPKHEFGIMQTEPKSGKRYDAYEPDRYNCISVDDALIVPILRELQSVKCYWHTLERLDDGLAYTGITLIPPESCSLIRERIRDNQELSQLNSLLREAEQNDKFVIHFGV